VNNLLVAILSPVLIVCIAGIIAIRRRRSPDPAKSYRTNTWSDALVVVMIVWTVLCIGGLLLAVASGDVGNVTVGVVALGIVLLFLIWAIRRRKKELG
jgi:amino acid transporter